MTDVKLTRIALLGLVAVLAIAPVAMADAPATPPALTAAAPSPTTTPPRPTTVGGVWMAFVAAFDAKDEPRTLDLIQFPFSCGGKPLASTDEYRARFRGRDTSFCFPDDLKLGTLGQWKPTTSGTKTTYKVYADCKVDGCSCMEAIVHFTIAPGESGLRVSEGGMDWFCD
ncbi:hypothetical protein HY631_04345 [Candidatus Uhrbacteria bacterium]|nr:hypothetical protein [Candidatus Uhrbacteria bacterium]